MFIAPGFNPGKEFPNITRDKNSLAQSRNTIDTPTPVAARGYDIFALQAKCY